MDHRGDVEQIEILKARYFRFLDTKDWDAWRDVFTPDLHAEAEGLTFSDRDSFVGLVAGLLEGVTSAHHGHLPEIDIDGDEATGIWAMADLLVFPGDPAPGIRGYGHYHERYRRGDDGRWRIASTVLTRLYVEPLAGGYPEGGPWPVST